MVHTWQLAITVPHLPALPSLLTAGALLPSPYTAAALLLAALVLQGHPVVSDSFHCPTIRMSLSTANYVSTTCSWEKGEGGSAWPVQCPGLGWHSYTGTGQHRRCSTCRPYSDTACPQHSPHCTPPPQSLHCRSLHIFDINSWQCILQGRRNYLGNLSI